MKLGLIIIVLGVQSSKRLPKPRPLKSQTQAAAPPSTRHRHHPQSKDPETLEAQVIPPPLRPAFPDVQSTATQSSES